MDDENFTRNAYCKISFFFFFLLFPYLGMFFRTKGVLKFFLGFEIVSD